MNRAIQGLVVVVLLSPQWPLLNAQKPAESNEMGCPMMHRQQRGKDPHHAAVDQHGDMAMGFSHDQTTHHFRLSPVGGAIEVTANSATDIESIGAIRSHLAHIASMFGGGDFSTPMFVHNTIPPGVTAMKLLKDSIRFGYESIESGGRVRIESGDPVAVAAIQDFLRFQIADHQTGDPLSGK
ncbi:MAG TPA: hypothetical protein VGF82_02000 [Terracidiphilus sp.]